MTRFLVCAVTFFLVESAHAEATNAPSPFSVPCAYLETCRTKLRGPLSKECIDTVDSPRCLESNLTYYSCTRGTRNVDKDSCTCAPQMRIKCPTEVGHYKGRFVTRSTSDSSTCDERAIEMVKNHLGCCAKHTYHVTHVTTAFIPIFDNSSCGIDVRSLCANWDDPSRSQTPATILLEIFFFVLLILTTYYHAVLSRPV